MALIDPCAKLQQAVAVRAPRAPPQLAHVDHKSCGRGRRPPTGSELVAVGEPTSGQGAAGGPGGVFNAVEAVGQIWALRDPRRA